MEYSDRGSFGLDILACVRRDDMRKIIKATKGHILTDGKIYGRRIYLAECADLTAFFEITLEEYESICEGLAKEL